MSVYLICIAGSTVLYKLIKNIKTKNKYQSFRRYGDFQCMSLILTIKLSLFSFIMYRYPIQITVKSDYTHPKSDKHQMWVYFAAQNSDK